MDSCCGRGNTQQAKSLDLWSWRINEDSSVAGLRPEAPLGSVCREFCSQSVFLWDTQKLLKGELIHAQAIPWMAPPMESLCQLFPAFFREHLLLGVCCVPAFAQGSLQRSSPGS